MQNAHTPGPWKHAGGFDDFEDIRGADGSIVAQMQGINYGRRKADARLIAAAPELLDALRKVVDVYCDIIKSEYKDDPDNYGLVRNARAAIAKAEGRQ